MRPHESLSHRRRSLVLAVAAALSLLAATGPALADTRPDTAEGAPSATSALAAPQMVGEDARSYAREFGVPLAEAARRLGLQARLGDVISQLQAVSGDRFAGAWIEHRPQFRVVLRVTDAPNGLTGVQNIARRAPAPVVIRTGAAESLARTLERNRVAGPALRHLLPTLAGTEVDVRTGQVVVTVGSDFGVRGSASTAAAAAAAQRLLGGRARVNVTRAPAGDGHTRGGAQLSSCTSGFVVQDSNGVSGFITAGHCPNSQTYSEPGGTSYTTTWQAQIRDADQDVQWHTTSHIEYPTFFARSASAYRTLTGRTLRSNQNVGDYVCHRGKTTGYSCGTIESRTFQPTWTNACNGVTCSSVWMKVSGSALECYPGDSGGPWFLNTDAYGIYKGQSSSGTTASDCDWAVYMAVNYVPGLGVSLVYG